VKNDSLLCSILVKDTKYKKIVEEEKIQYEQIKKYLPLFFLLFIFFSLINFYEGARFPELFYRRLIIGIFYLSIGIISILVYLSNKMNQFIISHIDKKLMMTLVELNKEIEQKISYCSMLFISFTIILILIFMLNINTIVPTLVAMIGIATIFTLVGSYHYIRKLKNLEYIYTEVFIAQENMGVKK
jgi:hypothetical protein